ncbi:MAG: hypothetical protein WC314_12630 [Vulcanimicrobiota bacterium]
MKSLNLYIQSALDSLGDCTRELQDARLDVVEQEAAEQDPPVSSMALDRVLAHCQKAQRELQTMARKVR